MQRAGLASPKTGAELVDEYFLENRTRLLEIAAFLDRLDRADRHLVERDYRVRTFREALALLGDRPDDASRGETRAHRIQMLLSDPSTEPLEHLDRKSARGAHDHWMLGSAP